MCCIKVEFKVKYGKNVIEIPIDKANPVFAKSDMTNLWQARVTIFNDISQSDGTRLFERFVIDKCQISGQIIDKANETIRNVVNAQTVITKDIEHYKSPIEYGSLSVDERNNFYTAQVGDFIVFGEVDDEVANAQEYAQLQIKYKNNGIKIVSVSANINGMAVDNVMMTNV